MTTVNSVPLVVDLDQSLITTDTLLEALCHGMGRDPFGTLKLFMTHLRDPAGLKAALYDVAPTDAALLPYNPAVLALIEEARVEGRPVVLASAADQRIVDAVSAHLGGFAVAIGSEGGVNLKAEAKAEALVARFGTGGFDYVGDSMADLPIWRAARKGYAVGMRQARLVALTAQGTELTPIGKPWSRSDLLAALRPHQWVKNVLLFLPIVAAHAVTAENILMVLAGIAVYSAAASAIYIINDLVDLQADRLHETKCRRPFAAGRVPVEVGISTSVVLATLAVIGAALMSLAMLGIILVYLVTTMAYSMHLKRVRWVDIATLAALYTLRVVAGGVAASVEASGWLIAFIFPVFLTLACVKRLTELAKAKSEARLPGRSYARLDRQDILNMALIGACAAIFVFVLYTFGEVANRLYQNIIGLRLVALPLSLWLARMIWTGWRGAQDYDPIEFALRDVRGLSMVVLVVLGLFWSAGVIG